MRQINVEKITKETARLCQEACYDLPLDVVKAIKNAAATERSPLGQNVLNKLLENANLASRERMPCCHDTGLAVVFVEIGQDIHLTGGSLREAISEGVRKGYQEGFLRKSVVGDPLERINTGDNTPAIIHTDIVEGDSIKITVVPKGGGSENMSALEFLLPGTVLKELRNLCWIPS